jgi:parvulin-like peptidyl-prolyl isomerase
LRRAVERFVVAVLPGLLLAGLWVVSAPAQNLNRVVIQVNDRIATLYDYQGRLEDFRRELAANDRLSLAERRERMQEVPNIVFSSLLDELLLLSRADQLGIVFTEEEVDAQLAQVRERYGFEDDAAFEAALAQSGTNLREFGEQMRYQMRMNEVMAREVRSKIDIGEEIARLYYRDNPEAFMTPQRMRLRELVVLESSQLTEAERRQLAESIRQEIAAGRSLDELVAEHQEAGNTSGVIELGWVAGGDLADELESAVWGLPVDGVSAPVASRGGLHVLQVVEREEEGLQPFNDVAEQAQLQAVNEAMGEGAQSYLIELEDQSYVRIEPPPEAAGFRRAQGRMPEEPEIPAATTASDAEAATGGEAPVAEGGES